MDGMGLETTYLTDPNPLLDIPLSNFVRPAEPPQGRTSQPHAQAEKNRFGWRRKKSNTALVARRLASCEFLIDEKNLQVSSCLIGEYL